MSLSFGSALKVSVFGQSHSPAIGCVVEGLPAGFALDTDELQRFMDRRAPGRNRWSTPRKEADRPRIVAGLNERGETCGTTFAALIENTNTRSADYEELCAVPRPGHADFTAWAKWGTAHDIAGGGAFSARLTAPLCVAGGVALQILGSYGVRVAAHASQIARVCDEPFDALDNSPEVAARLARQMDALADGRDFPALDATAKERMCAAIEEARIANDSVGGIVECVATGLPSGIGQARSGGIQSGIASAVFSLPAVKGLEFGAGFGVATLCGHENNDPYEVRNGSVAPATNMAGGSLGGISTSAPVLFRVAFKPTPSIAMPQQSVDLNTRTQTELVVRGRHDPCVVARAVPVVEAACALALLDLWLQDPPQPTSQA